VNQPERAIEHLKTLHVVELKDNRYAKRIARVYRDIGKLEDAEHYAVQPCMSSHTTWMRTSS
jgi:hypothetical protein